MGGALSLSMYRISLTPPVLQLNIAKRAVDKNGATHLIRNAIGHTDHGLAHGKLSAMLSLPDSFIRYYRDDITVTVIYFDETYLRASLDSIVPEDSYYNMQGLSD